MKKALMLGVALASTAVGAVEWIDLGISTSNQVQTFLDYDSVKRQEITVYGGSSSFKNPTEKSKYISAIFQYTYINNHPFRKKGLYYSKEHSLISCENESYFTKAQVDYGFKDEVVGSWQSNKRALFESDFSYTFPETVGGITIEQACNAIAIKEAGDTENLEDYL